MTAKDSFGRRRMGGIGKKFTYLAHYEEEAFDSTLWEVLNIPGMTAEIAPKIFTLCKRFMGEFVRISTHLGKPDTQSEFYEACKSRFKDLTQLNGVICTDARDMEEVNVFVQLRDGLHEFSGRWDRRHHVYGMAADEELYDLWSISERPGCYRWLFLADLITIAWAAEISLTDPLSGDEAWEHAAWLSTIVCSIGKVYEDIRPNKSYVEHQEKIALERLQEEHDLDHDSVWYQILMEVVDDIRDGTKPYIRDIAAAIRRADFDGNKLFTINDFHVSMRKTGSRYKNKSYPGIYSSLFEYDQPSYTTLMFDNYVEYVTHYNREPLDDVYQPDGLTITIEQHKLDRRVIHMGSNPRQDRLNYLHRRLQRFLDFLPEDCTRDQNRGIDFAKKVTAPMYRTSEKRNIYSLDISKATDTIDLEFQRICLDILFPKVVTDYWLEVNTADRTFNTVDNQRIQYKQTCGQAQGFKSSFPSFAWGHHIVFRMLMHAGGLDRMRANDVYRVLGDDSIMAVFDPDETLLNMYIDICQWINWSTNRSKGYIAHWDDPYAFAEFAKRRVLNGRINTPIPSKLLLNSEKTANGTIGLFQWISINYRPLSIADVYDISPRLKTIYSESEIKQIIWVAKSGVLPCFDGWMESNCVNTRDYTVEELVVISLSYFVTKLRSTLVDQFLPDTLRDVTEGGFDESRLNYFMNTKDEEELFDLAESLDNKYYVLLQANSDMIDYINHLLYSDRKAPESLGWIQLSTQLSSEEESRIFRCLEILDNLTNGTFPSDAMSAYLNLSTANKILTRFNPRGDSRVTFQNGTIWTPILTKLNQMLDMTTIIPDL